jgi:hypothetical protein
MTAERNGHESITGFPAERPLFGPQFSTGANVHTYSVSVPNEATLIRFSASSVARPLSSSLDLFQLEPKLIGYANAWLPFLPAPLELKHGPILLVVERWSDGTIIAKLPGARLQASGASESDAMDELAEDIAAAVRDLTGGEHASTRLGGAMLDTWRALCELVKAPGLDGRSRL